MRGGQRHFDSDPAALAAAGIPVAPTPPEWSWTPTQFQQAIRDLHASGVDLSSGRIRQMHRDLFYAARDRLGSWRKEVEGAGLEYDLIRRARSWSPQAILDRLRELHNAGTDLRAGTLQRTDVPLNGAVQRYFGTLRRAVGPSGSRTPRTLHAQWDTGRNRRCSKHCGS